jgi:hypothetical protein
MTKSRIIRIIEAGHYYQSHGITRLSELGVIIYEKIRTPETISVLFIDDIAEHKAPEEERSLDVLKNLDFKPDYTILESDMIIPAREILSKLKESGKKLGVKTNDRGTFTSGFKIADERGAPLCVLLDAAFAIKKAEIAFDYTQKTEKDKRTEIEVITLLPSIYEGEQQNLFRLLGKINPRIVFSAKTIIFDEDGEVVRELIWSKENGTEIREISATSDEKTKEMKTISGFKIK